MGGQGGEGPRQWVRISLCPEQADSDAQKEKAKGLRVMRKV